MQRRLAYLLLLGTVALLAVLPSPSPAYVEVAHSLGQVVQLSSNIMLLRVEKVDKEKNMILYRKVRDLKGTHPTEVIKHNIGRGGFHPREWQYPMEWAEVGKTAVFFHNGGASETCIGTYWYQAYAGGEWWNMSHGEPFLLRSFAGNVEKLAAAVTDILAGKEVVVPCMVDGNKEDLHLRRARIQRLRASLKLQDYNPKRDFVGWGGEDFRLLAGMPGFSHISSLPRVDPEARGVSCLDIDGDGKPDVCLVGGGRLALLQNGGESLVEMSLPGLTSGVRAAAWADSNGDGKPDLLVATMFGPRLFTNLGKLSFRDDTALLPKEEGYDLTAVAWVDADGDGKTDVLLANGFHGLRLYRNTGRPERPFEDASAAVSLPPPGPRSASLLVADVDGDGRADFLLGGRLFRNTGRGFAEVEGSGLAVPPGSSPAFGDYDGDGRPDLFVPHPDGGGRLFHNEGQGRFRDVSDTAGDLAKRFGHAVCAARGDFDRDGKPDLLVGCLRGPNRLFRNRGDGTFEEITEAVGLNQRIFNSRAVAFLDQNGDKVLDVVFVNEGQEPCLLLGRK